MKKKVLALVLAAMMLVSMFPIATLMVSADGNEASVQIGDAAPTEYATLAEALTAAKNAADGTKAIVVTLLTDVTAADSSWVKGDKVTLDGNNHTLTYTGTDYALCASGSSTEEGAAPSAQTIKNLTVSASAGGGVKTYYNATLKVENVTATNLGNVFWLAARDNSGIVLKNVTTNKSLNTLEKANTTVTYEDSSVALLTPVPKNCKVVINGGTFSCTTAGENLLTVANAGASLVINGGTFNATGNRLIQASTANAPVITINGGTFTTNCQFACNLNGNAQMTINGGNFTYTGESNPYMITTNSSGGANGWVKVYGGTFTNASTSGSSYLLRHGGNPVSVYGGFFKATGAGRLFTGCTVYGGTFDNCGTNASYCDNGTKMYGGVTYKNGAYNSTNPYTSTPKMTAGASVRLVADSNGIRFESYFKKALTDSLNAIKDNDTELKYGTIIIPTETLSAMGTYLTFDCLNIAGKVKGTDYVVVDATNGITVAQDGQVNIRAALVNIKAANVSKAFSAVGFVSYVKDGVTCYMYTGYNATDNSRSMKQVATAALADTNITWSAENTTILQGYAA